MFRKRKRPTPFFKIPPPYNPLAGDYAGLRNDGIFPYCAMMQIAEEDTYDDYVVCRGIDPRIRRFKDDISVAKPYGARHESGRYKVGEIYPAFLATQSVDSFVPQVPNDVPWRVGQTPGVCPNSGDRKGQPEGLADQVNILYDHNGKVVQWILIDFQASTDVVKRATCDQDMIRGNSYTVKVIGEGTPEPTIDEVKYDWLSDESISAGKELIVQYFPQEDTPVWRVTHAECEDESAPAPLNGGDAWGGGL